MALPPREQAVEPGADPTQREPQPDGAAASSGGVGWIDVILGGCVLVLVCWNVITRHYLLIDWHISAPVPVVWWTLADWTMPLCAPVLFVIWGRCADDAVRGPWRSLLNRWVLPYLGLFVVSTAGLTVVLGSLNPEFRIIRARDAVELSQQLTVTPSDLWFLYAAAVYVIIAKAVRRAPTPAVLGLAAVLAAATYAGLIPAPGNRAGMYANLAFFLVGVRWRPGLAWLTGKVGRWQGATRPLAAVGRAFLPIYVLHLPMLVVLDRLVWARVAGLTGPAQLAVAVVEPVLLTASLLVPGLALGRLTHRLGGRWWRDLSGFGVAGFGVAGFGVAGFGVAGFGRAVEEVRAG